MELAGYKKSSKKLKPVEESDTDDEYSLFTPNNEDTRISSKVGKNMDPDCNPLLNPVVLEVLFKHCTEVPQLRECRLVCKQWLDSSMPFWRRKATLVLMDESHDKDPEEHEYGNLFEFMDLTKLSLAGARNNDLIKLVKYPFRKYTLYKWTYDNDERRKVMVEDFWGTWGSSMYALYFDDCTLQDLPRLERAVFNQTPNLKKLVYVNCDTHKSQDSYEGENSLEVIPLQMEQKNLKTLKILGIGTDTETYNMFPHDWPKFFLKFPYVEKLKLEFGDENEEVNYGALKDMLVAAIEVRKWDKTKICLKYLDIFKLHLVESSLFPLNIAIYLKEAAFPLETLKIDIGQSTQDDVMKVILSAISKTIQHLELYQGFLGTVAMVGFPYNIQMHSLQHLELAGRVVNDLDVLRFTPNLQRLHVVFSHEEFTKVCRPLREDLLEEDVNIIDKALDLPRMDKVNLGSLEDFRYYYPIQDKHLEVLGKLMPNLETLHVFTPLQNFYLICKQWKATLKVLYLFTEDKISHKIVAKLLAGEEDSNQEEADDIIESLSSAASEGMENFTCIAWEEHKNKLALRAHWSRLAREEVLPDFRVLQFMTTNF